MNAARDSRTTMIDDVSQSEEQPALDTMLMLPTGTSAADIAAQCRDAAMQFINDSKGWSKAELSMWLTGSYASITRHAVKQEDEGTVWPVPLLRDIDVRLIDRIMGSARSEILTTLSNIARDGSASFVLRALIAGTVVRCEDGTGEPAWAPTTAATRLADRVLSLFAVDYLARPIDYETNLFVCSKCETVSFRQATFCETCQPAPHKASLTMPRHTLPYPPLGA